MSRQLIVPVLGISRIASHSIASQSISSHQVVSHPTSHTSLFANRKSSHRLARTHALNTTSGSEFRRTFPVPPSGKKKKRVDMVVVDNSPGLAQTSLNPSKIREYEHFLHPIHSPTRLLRTLDHTGTSTYAQHKSLSSVEESLSPNPGALPCLPCLPPVPQFPAQNCQSHPWPVIAAPQSQRFPSNKITPA